MSAWFRNLKIYRLPVGDYALNAALSKRPLAPCASLQLKSVGWVPPRGEAGQMVYAAQGHQLIALGVEEKLLPQGIVRQYAHARAAEIEREEERKVGRKEMRDIMERIAAEQMPTALRRLRTTWAWLDAANGFLVIDTGSDARADEFMEMLFATVDGIAPRTLQTQVSPTSAMTTWLAGGDAPAGFSIDSDTELRSASEAQAAIRYVHHSLAGPEIAEHIAAGKITTKLGMTWRDRVSFALTNKLHIKRLAFLDIIQEQAEQTAANADEQFDADFAIMCGELSAMIKDLVAALGGVMEE